MSYDGRRRVRSIASQKARKPRTQAITMIGRRMSWLSVQAPTARMAPQTTIATMIQRMIRSAPGGAKGVVMRTL